ncbi:hypothetical protein Anapl_01418 [Anas platyrhynchos]|uniref:Uncharacterized protein n=1 Tax=Anas platyrhynchos TaxID=8839 RepID=R0K456_ANAPL|nr:hypothetical protein Anapl_01418 [Anas platyrhynchos]
MLSIPITTTAHALCQTLSVYVPHLQAASNMKKQLALIQVQAPDRHTLTQGSAAPERGSGDPRRVSRACWGYCFPFLVAEQGQAEPHRHVWHTDLPLMVSMCSKICYSARVSKGGIKLSGRSTGYEHLRVQLQPHGTVLPPAASSALAGPPPPGCGLPSAQCKCPHALPLPSKTPKSQGQQAAVPSLLKQPRAQSPAGLSAEFPLLPALLLHQSHKLGAALAGSCSQEPHDCLTLKSGFQT